MVWSVETDDFHGKCHSRPFDLIKTIHESFIDGELTLPPPPTTTTRVSISLFLIDERQLLWEVKYSKYLKNINTLNKWLIDKYIKHLTSI